MQRQTSKGRIVIADDYIYEKHPSVANTYQVCQLVTAVILCVVVNWSACYATRNLKLAVASAVLDFLALMVIYAVLYEWVIGQLLWFGKSAETDSFMNLGVPAPLPEPRLRRGPRHGQRRQRRLRPPRATYARGPTGRAIHAERP